MQNSGTVYVGISELVQPHLEETSTVPIDITRDAALFVQAGVIRAAGPRKDILALAAGAETIDLGEHAVIPGLVDSHTHVVFAGDRIDDMARRARGETYESIAKAGGGIRRSVEMMQNATDTALVS